MEFGLLTDVLIIFSLSILVIYISNKIKVPPVTGYLLTGIIAGPFGLKLIGKLEEVNILAEIGVILILFSIGIEFSLSKLMKVRKNIILGGFIQVGLTILAVFAISYTLGEGTGKAIFFGFLVALSSTAIVLKLLQTGAELDSKHGRIILSILIFQDLIIVPMILLTPILAGTEGSWIEAVAAFFGKIAGIGVFLFISIRYIMPKLMALVASTRIKEIFLIAILLICMIVVWLSSLAGLSLALGAFLAGLIISETEYSHEALGFVEPFRDVFASFFFVSIGMMLDLDYLVENPVIILVILALVMIIKIIAGAASALSLGKTLKIAVIVGFGLAQIGEFSFVLSAYGISFGLLDNDIYQKFLSVAVIGIAVTPFLFRLANKVSGFMPDFSFTKTKKLEKLDNGNDDYVSNRDHMVIIGYGFNGRNIANAAVYAGLSYVVIEYNPVTVRNEKAKGTPIFYGDATKEPVLMHAGIKKARIVVVVISDAAAVRAIVANIRNINPEVHIIVRSRFIGEVKELYHLGANEVVTEEFETSIEIFSRILNRYFVPKNEIAKLVENIRFEGFSIFRDMQNGPTFNDLTFRTPDHDIRSVRISGSCYVCGKSLKELDLRNKHGLTVIAIDRDNELIPAPHADFRVMEGDLLVLFGRNEKLEDAESLFTDQAPGNGVNL